MILRHLTENAELISIMNHLGHCLSHVSVLKIENAIYRRVLFSSKIIHPSISRTDNAVLHFAWDNFDLCEQTVSGSSTTHSTHGIVIQEITQAATQNITTPADTPSDPDARFMNED